MRTLVALLLLSGVALADPPPPAAPPAPPPTDAELVEAKCAGAARDLDRIRLDQSGTPEGHARLVKTFEERLAKCRVDEQHKLDFGRQMRASRVRPAPGAKQEPAKPAGDIRSPMPPWRKQ